MLVRTLVRPDYVRYIHISKANECHSELLSHVLAIVLFVLLLFIEKSLNLLLLVQSILMFCRSVYSHNFFFSLSELFQDLDLFPPIGMRFNSLMSCLVFVIMDFPFIMNICALNSHNTIVFH